MYELNSEVRDEIKRLINDNFSEIINEFRKYFKRDISVIKVHIKRNYSLENFDLVNKSKKVEFLIIIFTVTITLETILNYL